MVKRGENRLWEAFCPLHMHTITQAAVRGRPQAVIPQPTPIALPDCLGAPYYLCGLGYYFFNDLQVYVCIPPKILVYTLLYK